MMEELSARNDQFVLGNGDAQEDVRWLRARNGEIEGLITGATQDAEKTYDQTIAKSEETGAPFQVDQNGLQGEPGSDQFSQQLMQMLTQLFQGLFGNLLGGAANDAPAAEQTVDAAPGANATRGTNALAGADDVNAATDVTQGGDAMQQPDVNTDMMGTIEGLQQMLDVVKRLFQLFSQLGSLSQGGRRNTLAA
jgi:hypothetical protein